MRKIKIRLPATITNLGPGLHSLGLALGLHTTVEISGREDNELRVETEGEGADRFKSVLKHPVLLAMSRFFQRIENTKMGINIRVQNQIPLNSGLGAETAFAVAGVLGANNLLGDLYKRDELLDLAASISRPDGVAAALMGGLVAGMLHEDVLTHATLPVTAFDVVVVVPDLDDYAAPTLPEEISRRAALGNMARIPLLTEALRKGDLKLLANTLDDQLLAPRTSERITGYAHVREIAMRQGALKVVPCGDGPAVIALTESRHDALAEEMRLAFKGAGIEARAWVLPIDTQGVVISIAQSA